MINMGVDDWFTITFDNKPAGEINLRSTFEPEGGDQYENARNAFEE